MEIKLNITFECPENIKPFLEKVFQGEYDLDVHLPSGGRIIDLGANYGAFALWAAHRWPGALVKSFEPNPEVFKILSKNVASYPQIEVNNWGIGTPGIRTLNKGPNNEGESSFHSIMNAGDLGGIDCEVKDPSTLPECDLLKLDIEGCEMEVLAPLISSRYKPAVILLEYHNHKLRREVDQLLSEYVLIGGETTTIMGLGVAKYLRNDIFENILKSVTKK